MLEEALAPVLEGGAGPHLAVLVRTRGELPKLLAEFYAMGARRDGWLVHEAMPGAVERERAALSAAGLDAATLEAQGRLRVAELDPRLAAEERGPAWEAAYERALEEGFTATWHSRLAVAEEFAPYEVVACHDRAWDSWRRGRRVMTLCPYVVGRLDPAAMLDRFASLSEFHDGIVVAGGGAAALYAGAPEYATH